nr:2-dehydro-3-deoxyphosphooctonate aldolase 1 [Tanacetum cinerariifolium]
LEGGGVASGGLRELIPCIARTAVAVGVDGLFMEVHDDPLSAPVDGPTQWVADITHALQQPAGKKVRIFLCSMLGRDLFKQMCRSCIASEHKSV